MQPLSHNYLAPLTPKFRVLILKNEFRKLNLTCSLKDKCQEFVMVLFICSHGFCEKAAEQNAPKEIFSFLSELEFEPPIRVE